MMLAIKRFLRPIPVLICLAAGVGGVSGEEKTQSGQSLLRVDWADAEIVAFKRSGTVGAASAGLDGSQLQRVHLPVLAFTGIPQIVKNVAGPEAKPLKPRLLTTDPTHPDWYHLVDTFEGITISVDADRRINHQVDKKFQIGAAKDGAEATLGGKGKARISIFDGSQEEGMEGLVIEYTVQKFPDIPYTVTIECAAKAKSQCKDLAVVTKDQALLGLIAASGG
jgi:hypothetical protein